MTHICVSELNIISWDNGLAPRRRQAIIWTSAGLLLIESLGTNLSENVILIDTFSFTKIHNKYVVWEMAAILTKPQCVKYFELHNFNDGEEILGPDSI